MGKLKNMAPGGVNHAGVVQMSAHSVYKAAEAELGDEFGDTTAKATPKGEVAGTINHHKEFGEHKDKKIKRVKKDSKDKKNKYKKPLEGQLIPQVNAKGHVKLEGSVPAKVQSFFDALQHAYGSRLLICLKGYPDPDNIATSVALRWMAKLFQIECEIIYFEEISHHENRALVKKLDIELTQYSQEFDLSSYDYYAVNDSQTADLPIELGEKCQLLIFVDHHKILGQVQGVHVDIRENAGSTASIYGEYLMHSPLPFTGSDYEQNRVATALMHGIRTDTDNFVNAQPIDFQASQFFAKKVDRDLLALISRQSIPAKTMDLTQIALQSKDVKETFLFSGVGYVREEDRDGIGQCADYLLNREGIETVVVYGIVGNLCIDGSLRTKSHTLDPDRWLKDVFGHDKEGQWYGGGRKDKGGFQIPLGVFSKCSDTAVLWELVKKTLDELFYEKIGVTSKARRKYDHPSNGT